MGGTAMVIGATGLVGREVTDELLRSGWKEVRLLTRRLLDIKNGRLSQHLVDWDRLDEYSELFQGVDALFCCLGTTIKTAGSQANFERVDLEYPLKAAELAHKAGVKQLLVVSALGANPRSRQFYSRTKGRMEEGVSRSGIPGVHLFRPSLLLGEREEFRRGERAAAILMTRLEFLMVGRAAKYRAVKGSTVARAMVHIAEASPPGIHVYPNDVIHALGLQ